LTYTTFDVILLVGVSHGFLVAGSLLYKMHRSPSKVLLALSLLVFNLLCLKILIHTTGLWQTNTFRYFPLAVELAIQPLMWLYIRSLTQLDFKFRKKQLIHFIPFGLSLAYSIFIYSIALNEIQLVDKDNLVNRFYFNTLKEIEDYLSVISAFIYWALGWKVLLQFRAWVFGNTSNTDFPTYVWLRNIALLMGLLIVMLFLDVTLDYFFSIGKQVFIHWQIFFVYLAGLIYYMGFRGYQLPDHPFQVVQIEVENTVPSYPTEEATPIEQPKLALSEEKLNELREAVTHAFESNHVYLDVDLNIQKLANIVQINPSLLSAAINQLFGKNFRNFVNSYRLNHVKKRLTDPANSHKSIIGIALESGFNSEASFYRIFKSVEGMSPKEYILKSRSKE
jgi:AraC-like DNA-binding protein